MTDTTASVDQLHADLVREYVTISEQLEPMQSRLDEIRKVLRADLPIGTHRIAGTQVQKARNARLDMKAFEARYPVVQYPELYKATPDSDAIKRHLAPVDVEALQVEGEPRLVIK